MITTFDSQHLISQAHLKRKKKKNLQFTIQYQFMIEKTFWPPKLEKISSQDTE